MEGEVMVIEKDAVIEDMHNALIVKQWVILKRIATLIVKEWVILKRIATLSMVFLIR